MQNTATKKYHFLAGTEGWVPSQSGMTNNTDLGWRFVKHKRVAKNARATMGGCLRSVALGNATTQTFSWTKSLNWSTDFSIPSWAVIRSVTVGYDYRFDIAKDGVLTGPQLNTTRSGPVELLSAAGTSLSTISAPAYWSTANAFGGKSANDGTSHYPGSSSQPKPYVYPVDDDTNHGWATVLGTIAVPPDVSRATSSFQLRLGSAIQPIPFAGTRNHFRIRQDRVTISVTYSRRRVSVN